jgi:hypothetical protein
MTGSSTLGNLGLSAASRPTCIRHRVVATNIYLHPFFTCMLALQIAFQAHKEGGAQSGTKKELSQHTVLLLILVYFNRRLLRYGMAMLELGGLGTVFDKSAGHISCSGGKEERIGVDVVPVFAARCGSCRLVGASRRLSGWCRSLEQERVGCCRYKWTASGCCWSVLCRTVARRLRRLESVFGRIEGMNSTIFSRNTTKSNCFLSVEETKPGLHDRIPCFSGVKRHEEPRQWSSWC